MILGMIFWPIAIYFGVIWLIHGLGLALITYGVDCRGKRLSGASKFVGFILVLTYWILVSIGRDPAELVLLIIPPM